ncbi:hypothetical protein LSH36_583g00010 [Paralvinella palmiformis]|uniref:FtsK domain-containing protein n=1 Tax=Paralvinella palmiformis TaxID=53620 RepID=A0AAD9J5F4_9ANNE|nr:hypothetical protein LSH36_583g00010 [Paralvinella palmiformis]
MHSHNTSLPDKNTTDISHPITSSQSYITPNQHIDHTLVHHNTNRPTSEPSTSLNNISSADSHHKTSLANELPTPHISNEYTSATFISIEDTTLHIKKSNSPSSDAEHPYKIYKVPQTETKPEKDQNITFPYTDSDAYKEKELAPQNQINNIWGDKPLEAVPPNESLHIEHPSSEEIQNHSCYHISPQAVQHVSTSTHTYSPQEIKNIIIKLESSLKEFGIEAKVTSVHQGPSITMFEVLPAPGIKLIRISNLADNIALRLAAKSVRIVAPIPGKEAVGIEIPNKPRRIVHFGNLISSKQYQNETITLPIVLGEDIMGISQITDLTTLPHLLIAGATGSGKSVCVNSIICSLLYRCSPEQVKLIMIDPKIVELNFYNDIPHLLTPVITKPQQAFQVLQYCICEMEHRYNQLEQMGVRDIDSYNQRATHSGLLPYIVVIIDEFADLMMSSGKDMESTVSRLTAMSRAVGIHLVLATQRPSADVITGLIKANIPSRIAFMVASKIDSRIILDTAGAEKLLGQGDMLFCSPWDPHPTRIQGAYLSETEIECVVDEVKKFGSPQYIDDEIFIEEEQTYEAEGAEDPLLIQAIELVSKLQRASTSFLQRKFRIGYNRAARLIEAMENKGIVGPQNGSKPRNVFPS